MDKVHSLQNCYIDNLNTDFNICLQYFIVWVHSQWNFICKCAFLFARQQMVSSVFVRCKNPPKCSSSVQAWTVGFVEVTIIHASYYLLYLFLVYCTTPWVKRISVVLMASLYFVFILNTDVLKNKGKLYLKSLLIAVVLPTTIMSDGLVSQDSVLLVSTKVFTEIEPIGTQVVFNLF